MTHPAARQTCIGYAKRRCRRLSCRLSCRLLLQCGRRDGITGVSCQSDRKQAREGLICEHETHSTPQPLVHFTYENGR